MTAQQGTHSVLDNSETEPSVSDIRKYFGDGPLDTSISIYSSELVVVLSKTQQEKRDELISQIEHNEDKIDKQRVTDFLRSYGLEVRPFIVVDAENWYKVNHFLGDDLRTIDTNGFYDAISDLAVVPYLEADEKYNKGATEANLVHELAHANHRDSFYIGTPKVDDKYSVMPRHGLSVIGYGDFFEEGFAETMSIKYIQEALGRKKGFPPEDHVAHESAPDDSVFVIPGKYHRLTEDDSDSPAPAVAAYGMELLIAKDPAIFDAMLLARHDVAGLREFARRVEALSPGLYGYLRSLYYKTTAQTLGYDFLQGVQVILDEVYEGSQYKADEAIQALEEAA